MRHTAPWTDYTGNPIQEGDRMVHSCGDCGIVVLLPGQADDSERWRVDYGHGIVRSLAHEVSATGRAIVIDETGKDL